MNPENGLVFFPQHTDPSAREVCGPSIHLDKRGYSFLPLSRTTVHFRFSGNKNMSSTADGPDTSAISTEVTGFSPSIYSVFQCTVIHISVSNISVTRCFWTVVLEKTLEGPLDFKEVQPVHPKEDQSWVFIGRTDVEAETPILWPPDAKNQFIWKDPDAGKNWDQEEKGTTEAEMVGWHHQLNGHGFG